MLKDAGYQEKIIWLKPWLVQIVDVVKKDLRQEHLKKDRDFCLRNFLGKNPQNIPVEQMAEAYAKEIAAGNVALGEFIATRWLIKHTDIYHFFETVLKEVTPDFEQLEQLDTELSTRLMEESVARFGATQVYLFVILNSVVFVEEVLKKLRTLAEQENVEHAQKSEEEEVAKTLAQMQKKHERELRALCDKHDKKLTGLQQKYVKDTEVLKGQVRRLMQTASNTVPKK